MDLLIRLRGTFGGTIRPLYYVIIKHTVTQEQLETAGDCWQLESTKLYQPHQPRPLNQLPGNQVEATKKNRKEGQKVNSGLQHLSS